MNENTENRETVEVKAEERPKRTSKGSGRRKTSVVEKLSGITFDIDKVRKLASFYSNTDAKMAELLEIDESTLNRWKEDKTFLQALKEGKAIADENVGKSLYERAMGYEHPEEQIFCYQGQIIRAQTVKKYPPDATSMIFWLKNRQPALWRDRTEIEHSGEMKLNVVEQKESDVEKELQEILAGNNIAANKETAVR